LAPAPNLIGPLKTENHFIICTSGLLQIDTRTRAMETEPKI